MGQVSTERVPVATLRQAIDRLSSLFGDGSAPAISIEKAVKRLGYEDDGTAAHRMIDTLAAYGLAERTAAAQLEPTPLGRRILRPSHQFDHDAALVDAAAVPPLFRAARDHFRDRPLDRDELRHWLRRRGVDKPSLDAAVHVLCKTAEFIREPQRRMAAVLAAVAERARSPVKEELDRRAVTAPVAGHGDLESTDIAWE